MFRVLSGTSPEPISFSRRELLRVGLLGGLAGQLSPKIQAASPSSGLPGFGKAKSVIVVYTNGGMSQIDSWDPKPDAPANVRGEFLPISTSVAGTYVTEHLPRLARMADRYAIVRSVSHDDLDHGTATYYALTGRRHALKSANPPPDPNDFPTHGSVLSRSRPTANFPYSAVHVNGPAFVPLFAGPGQNGGFLGRDFDPLLLGDVESKPAGLEGLTRQEQLPSLRISARQSLLSSIDGLRTELDQQPKFGDLDSLYGQAYRMLDTPRCREAFDLTLESDSIRERYGRNRAGQACLLARRLVEADVPWITVFFNHNARGQDLDTAATDLYGWDTHNDIFTAMKDHLMPRFDLGFSALLEDLEQRGLLETTLVVCMGEFGRAPRVALEKSFSGESPGRKHWAGVYSVVLAGAGVRPGLVYGSSDRMGAYPQSQMTSPEDLTATMFSALGIDPARHFTDHLDRPFPISLGTPLQGLY